MNDDSDLGKYGRAMLGMELKHLDLLGLIKDRCVISLILEHFSVQTTYCKLSSISRTLPWADSVRVVMNCDRRFRCTCPSRPFAHSYVWVCEWLRYESTLILGREYGRWSYSRMEKVVHPYRVFIYCNGRALGHWWAWTYTLTLT